MAETRSRSVVTPERFARGMTFDEYVRYVASPENLAREAWGGYMPDKGSTPTARKDNSAIFRERYASARLSEQQAAAITWLAAQPGGPAKILMISEEWSSDCRRDVPIMARLAEAGVDPAGRWPCVARGTGSVALNSPLGLGQPRF